MTSPVTPGERLDGVALERARRRATWLLVAAAALGSIANIAAWTVIGLAARELLGDTGLAGSSTSVIILGSALGTSLLASLMVRSSRRTGLAVGLLVAVVGALAAGVAVVADSFALLLVGSLLFGFGNAATQLSRYAAADMAAPERRAQAIGLVVWAGTVGAVVGPNLAPLAASLSTELGMAELAGPMLLAAVIMAVAGAILLIWLRPDPYELADESGRISHEDDPGAPVLAILRRPAVATAVVALVVGQVVMVAIMTMTPLYMDDHGHSLGAVGLVISAHTLGMFALSPLSGRIAARLGAVPALLAGMGVLATSAGLAALAPVDGALLGFALFLLGYGWNLGFVAGSTLLTTGVAHAERTRAEGASDTLVWGSSALASLGSGVVVATIGFGALGLLGLALLALGTAVVLRMQRMLSPSPAPS